MNNKLNVITYKPKTTNFNFNLNSNKSNSLNVTTYNSLSEYEEIDYSAENNDSLIFENSDYKQQNKLELGGNNQIEKNEVSYNYKINSFTNSPNNICSKMIGFDLLTPSIEIENKDLEEYIYNFSKEQSKEEVDLILNPFIECQKTKQPYKVDWKKIEELGIYSLMTAGLLNNGKIVLDDKIINTIDISSATIDIIVKAEKAGVKIDYKKIDRPQYIMNLILEILKPKETLQFKEKYTDGTATEPFCYYHSEEFDPSIPINYWDGDTLDASNFVYPKDEATGKSLGAWPKNYEDIPIKLENPKIYKDNFIWPVTPTNGKYIFGYSHPGIDIAAEFGTPVYAPVDGVITYSSYGDTTNRATNETAYSITIEMNEELNVNGKVVDEVYLTHLSGLRYRCELNQESVEVKKGDLIGFVGTAQGAGNLDNPSVPLWAPHLHMSIYKDENFNDGIKTNGIEQIYGIQSGNNIRAGE